MNVGVLVDTTRCVGCNACAEACKEANELPGDIDAKLTSRTWTVVEEHGDTYVRRMCMHCADPSCASVCPVGALYKSDEGPVAYEESRCIGCRYCMLACPFEVPKYEWDRPLPRIRKCIGCIDRVRDGEVPACVAACPAEATTFGPRDELLDEARRRIREDPDTYVDHIYGEREVGGTNVLFLASVPFGQLGFASNLPDTEMPSLTWQALSKVPHVVSIGGVALLGIWWIVNRRMEIEKLEAADAADRSSATNGVLEVEES